MKNKINNLFIWDHENDLVAATARGDQLMIYDVFVEYSSY